MIYLQHMYCECSFDFMRILLRLLYIGVLVVSSHLISGTQIASATSISTNQLETASSLPKGEYNLTLSGMTATNSNPADSLKGVSLEYSITDRLASTLSFYHASSDLFLPIVRRKGANDTIQLDIKYQLRREKLYSPGCAIGINGLTLDNPEAYIVFTKHATKLIGFHGGVKLNTFGISDAPRPFAGFELNPIPDVVRLSADYQWNFHSLNAGIFGFGLYYSQSEDAEIGVKWFHFDEFNNRIVNAPSSFNIESSDYLAVQYLFKF